MIGTVINGIFSVLDKVLPNPSEAAAAKLKVLELQQTGELKQLETAAGVVISEAQGEGWLQKNWRPITMLTFVFIVANNYIIYPYLSLFWDKAPMLPLPDHLWKLLELGITGYILGRSGEKIAKEFKR